jgi:phenylacetate-CoA oxygenase PaaH subunit
MMKIFEVFARREEGGPMVHISSLEATDIEMAIILAKETFGRRADVLEFWVVDRDHILSSKDYGIESYPVVPKPYRLGEYYRRNLKLRAELKKRISNTS